MPKQSNFKSIIFLSLSLIFQIFVTAQTPELPAELKPFILPDHEVLDFQTGDINKDQRPDAIMVLKNPLEDSTWEEFMPRPFLNG